MLAFLPLFTDNKTFSLRHIGDFFEHDLFRNQTNNKAMFSVPHRREVNLYIRAKTKNDFNDTEKVGESWRDRNSIAGKNEYNINLNFCNKLNEETSRLLDFVQSYIPIIPTHVTLVNHKCSLLPHLDCLPEQKGMYHKGIDPSNIKIPLNLEDYDNTVYFIKDDRKIYVDKEKNIPKTTNVFAWSENNIKHGTDYNLGTNRILLNVFGVLDTEKYKLLLEKSLKEYEEYVIRF
jgi:hypothetical protein